MTQSVPGKTVLLNRGTEKYSNRDLKNYEICFLTKFGIYNWKFTSSHSQVCTSQAAIV